MPDSSVRLGEAELQTLVERALHNAGLVAKNAPSVARSIVACEVDGAKNHGLIRLPGFIHSLALSWANGSAEPVVVSEAPSMLTVDACNGYAQVALAHVRERLERMARQSGVAVALIRNSHHYSALWPDIEPFAANGLLALTCVNSKKRMAVWGAKEPVTGTNAIGFAAPRPGALPLVWDQSSSVMAQGEVLLAAAEGRDVPLGVGCDVLGEVTTSPAAILAGGALLPFGGAKGASLAVMVEILAAALTGSPFGFEDDSPQGGATSSLGGQFLLVIDPKSTSSFVERMKHFFVTLGEAGVERFPGDRRYQQREQSRIHGVELSKANYEQLLQYAADRDIGAH